VFSQQSDADRNVVHFVLEEAVTTTDLSGHRRTAILAARNLGRPFTIVTDLTNCETISSPVVNEVSETVSHHVPFGLEREMRVVSDTTPETVTETFAETATTPDVEVLTVPSMDAADEEINDDSDRATA